MKVILKNGSTLKVKSTTSDTFDNTKKQYHLVDKNGDTVWYNDEYLHHPESEIKEIIL